MYYASIGIISIIVLVIVNFEALRKVKGPDISEVRIEYRWFLLTLLSYFLVDALWGIFDEQGWVAVTYIDTILDFSTMILGNLEATETWGLTLIILFIPKEPQPWKTSWLTNAVSSNDNREVQAATYYRYRDRAAQTTYYFQRWTDWSDYTESPVDESDTVEVETKVQYRYKSKET